MKWAHVVRPGRCRPVRGKGPDVSEATRRFRRGAAKATRRPETVVHQLRRVRPRLRVAMVVPPWYELPPQGYGGLEMIVAALVDGLVDRGHQVTLFGAGRRTGTRATFVSTVGEP